MIELTRLRIASILSIVLGLILVSCSPDKIDEAMLEQFPPVFETVSSASNNSTGSNTSFSEANAAALMYAMIGEDQQRLESALARLRRERDERYIPVLIELLRAAEIGLINPLAYPEYIDLLQDLSEQALGGDWPAWVEWYGTADIEPPPGFTSWKGMLYSPIDPGFGEFLQDGFPSRIRVEEIQWGGVVVDGIPALDNPAMLPAIEADYLLPNEPVFGISLNGEARAYPLRIMDWHEMANDVVGGIPVSLAYCTLCGAGIAFDGRVSGVAGDDSITYTFGSSGLLFRSNKLMYDRQTRTLWNQLAGEPVLGTLADQDIRLSILPMVLTTWEVWQAQHPDTMVLDINTGYSRPYEIGAAYADYFISNETMFPVWQRSQHLPDKARIYAINLDGIAKAYPVDILGDEQVVNDQVGGVPVVLVARRGIVEVQGQNARSSLQDGNGLSNPVAFEAGLEVRVFQRGEERFAPGADFDSLVDSQGQVWQISEDHLIGPRGEQYARVAGHLAYWVGWYAFFPNTLVYEGAH